MAEVRYMSPAVKYIKKIKDKQLKKKFKEAIERIAEDYTIGEAKIGDLAGIYCYDVYYNKTNYEIAYTVEIHDNEIVVVIMAGTRENFYDELKKYMK